MQKGSLMALEARALEAKPWIATLASSIAAARRKSAVERGELGGAAMEGTNKGRTVGRCIPEGAGAHGRTTLARVHPRG